MLSSTVKVEWWEFMHASIDFWNWLCKLNQKIGQTDDELNSQLVDYIWEGENNAKL